MVFLRAVQFLYVRMSAGRPMNCNRFKKVIRDKYDYECLISFSFIRSKYAIINASTNSTLKVIRIIFKLIQSNI